jgi:hypothetical protein
MTHAPNGGRSLLTNRRSALGQQSNRLPGIGSACQGGGNAGRFGHSPGRWENAPLVARQDRTQAHLRCAALARRRGRCRNSGRGPHHRRALRRVHLSSRGKSLVALDRVGARCRCARSSKTPPLRARSRLEPKVNARPRDVAGEGDATSRGIRRRSSPPVRRNSLRGTKSAIGCCQP